MKKLLLTLIVSIGSIAHAGAISGGGGKGVVCRDSQGVITSAQTSDLYEGKVLYGLNIVSDSAPAFDQVKSALNTIPESSRGLITYYTSIVIKGMQIVHGMDLLPIEDALLVAIPHGCKPEQLANYFDDKHILVDGDIWDRMDPTNQASLILHEAVYASERVNGAKNSQRSRHIVASLFDPSTKWVDTVEGLPVKGSYLNCGAAGSFFRAFKNSENEWILQFQLLGGGNVMSKKIFSVPQLAGFDFEEAKTLPILSGDDKIGTQNSLSGSARSIFEDSDLVTITKKWEAIKDKSGQVVKGYQVPRYYLTWTSATYPDSAVYEQLINCSFIFP